LYFCDFKINNYLLLSGLDYILTVCGNKTEKQLSCEVLRNLF